VENWESYPVLAPESLSYVDEIYVSRTPHIKHGRRGSRINDRPIERAF
jgi:hypothetical protein